MANGWPLFIGKSKITSTITRGNKMPHKTALTSISVRLGIPDLKQIQSVLFTDNWIRPYRLIGKDTAFSLLELWIRVPLGSLRIWKECTSHLCDRVKALVSTYDKNFSILSTTPTKPDGQAPTFKIGKIKPEPVLVSLKETSNKFLQAFRVRIPKWAPLVLTLTRLQALAQRRAFL